jgi:UDP-N-acetylglucosamine diphosphorylase / glucose-1-phosphate thymidylyltransferase / UDP-N-acetylgalactosamine diphosphorylase / glucosamine-1-phosphate N-acetyltransferase / galactosamine-1-phosphate N-acetyltransferase
MKALVLAGGRGKRLDDLSENCNKCMIRIGGRPIIEYNLDCLADLSISEVVVVVGYKAEDVINYLQNPYKNKKIKYVIQKEQKGLVHAIECARDAIGGDEFILLLGDEILINRRHQAMVNEYLKGNLFAICGMLKAEHRELIKKTYTIIQDENNNIYRLIEKPRKPLNDYQGTGFCIFKNKIYDYIDFTPIHHERMEKELPDLIQCAVDDGMVVKSFIACDKYININTKNDIETAERYLIDQAV